MDAAQSSPNNNIAAAPEREAGKREGPSHEKGNTDRNITTTQPQSRAKAMHRGRTHRHARQPRTTRRSAHDGYKGRPLLSPCLKIAKKRRLGEEKKKKKILAILQPRAPVRPSSRRADCGRWDGKLCTRGSSRRHPLCASLAARTKKTLRHVRTMKCTTVASLTKTEGRVARSALDVDSQRTVTRKTGMGHK